MERKIGEKFTQGVNTLRVAREDQDNWCVGCYYNHGGLSNCFSKEVLENRGECRKGYRTDDTGVCFRETFMSKNVKPIAYISVVVISGLIWYGIFKLILGL